MPYLRDGAPYIWTTWLAKIMAGENTCEWAAWFKARHDPNSWRKTARTSFDSWHLQHTAMLAREHRRWQERDFSVLLEDQNHFNLRGKTATLAGKPDIIALNGSSGVIVDVKTGQPSPAHNAQVMLYMYAVPRAMPQHQHMIFDGAVVYEDHEVNIPAVAIADVFIDEVSSLIRRLAADTPPRRAPSVRECRFCDITLEDCPDRVDYGVTAAVTSDF